MPSVIKGANKVKQLNKKKKTAADYYCLLSSTVKNGTDCARQSNPEELD